MRFGLSLFHRRRDEEAAVPTEREQTLTVHLDDGVEVTGTATLVRAAGFAVVDSAVSFDSSDSFAAIAAHDSQASAASRTSTATLVMRTTNATNFRWLVSP